MASLREIKTRVNSVRNTAKITRAMQMISASKMVKAQERSKSAEPYAEALAEMFKKIGKVSDYSHPFLNVRPIRNVCFLIIGSSRGFVGGMTANMMYSIAMKKDELLKKNPDVKFKAITMHKVGSRIAQNVGLEIDFHFADFVDDPTSTFLTPIKKVIHEKIEKEEYDQIYVVYTKFVNTVIQKSVIQKLLPIEIEELETQNESLVEKNKTNQKEYIFEPDTKTLLDALIPEYFENQIFAGLLQSIASEHSARMVAMKNATDNANELKDGLTLKYNKTRQAAITQEIIEIVSGSLV